MNMTQHSIKVYAQSTKFPAHTFLRDYEIEAKSESEAGVIARRNFKAKHGDGAKITHVETGGIRRVPGHGRAL